MKQKSKGSTSMEGSNGDFDKESGHHNHTYNNCNFHHYHFCNEANGNEVENPPLKQADEEQKLTEKKPHAHALPNNDGFPVEKPYVQIQSGANPNIHNHYNIHHHHHYHNQNEANGGEDKEPNEQQDCLKESLPVNDTPSNGDEEEKPIEITPPAETLPINPTPSASIDLVHSPTEKPYVRIQSKYNAQFFLSIRDEKVVVVLFDPNDESQHWYQNYSEITDKFGKHFFSLVNKSTGQAIEYSDQDDSPVQLTSCNPRVLCTSMLWKSTSLFSLALENDNMHLISPLDYPRYALDAIFSAGVSRQSYLVDINRSNLSFSGTDRWEIIDYLVPLEMVKPISFGQLESRCM